MENFSLSDEDFYLFQKCIYEKCGITFSDLNRATLESRVWMSIHGEDFSSPRDFYDKITTDNASMDRFLDLVTTNLTSFFRSPLQLEAVVKTVLPMLVNQKCIEKVKTINIWSAGCSTGEEAYTLAMIFENYLPPHLSYKVIASDLSLNSLEIGKAGIYPTKKLTDIPEKYAGKFIESQENDQFKICDSIMKNVIFDYHNLIHPAKFSDFDLVFCRNVLIYFDTAAQMEVLDNIFESLAPNGYLFLGHSESIIGMDSRFDFLHDSNVCFYKKK